MTEQPCHVACYSFATGKECYQKMKTSRWHYTRPVPQYVPDLSDPRWLADVVTGLVAQGINMMIHPPLQGSTEGKYAQPEIMLIGGWRGQPHVNAAARGPDIPSALCAAIKAARETGNGQV